MKRDFDLIRSILFQAEAAPPGEPLMQIGIGEKVSGAELVEHIQLLLDESLIDGEVLPVDQCAFAIYRLTSKGHDFVDAARSETIWNEAKEKLVKVGGPASLEIFKAVLIQIAKVHLRLA